MIGFKEAKKQEDDRNGRKATSINEHILTVSKIYKTQGMPKTLLCRVGWLAYHQCRLCLMHQTLDHLLRRNWLSNQFHAVLLAFDMNTLRLLWLLYVYISTKMCLKSRSLKLKCHDNYILFSVHHFIISSIYPFAYRSNFRKKLIAFKDPYQSSKNIAYRDIFFNLQNRIIVPFTTMSISVEGSI